MNLVNRYLDPVMIQRLNQLQLSARRVVEGTTTGLHRSPLKGASVEFRQHRFYVAGDDPRRLDWRVLGRTDRPYVKEYDEETNLRCVLALDASGSMSYGRTPDNKFDYACRCVASLAYLMLARTESVGFSSLGEKILRWIPPRAGTVQLSRVMSALQRTAPSGQGNLGACVNELANRLDRRSLVVIISDLLGDIDAFRQGLAHLAHNRHEVICLQILHADEQEFPFKHWTRFRGLEAEPSRLCEPAMARQIYLQNFQTHQRQLSQCISALGVDYETFITKMDLMDELTGFLRRRRRR